MALKYFVEAGVLAVRRVPKDDLKWVPAMCNLCSSCTCLELAATAILQAYQQLLTCVVRACRRVAKATGATVVLTLADMEGNEVRGTACPCCSCWKCHLQF